MSFHREEIISTEILVSLPVMQFSILIILFVLDTCNDWEGSGGQHGGQFEKMSPWSNHVDFQGFEWVSSCKLLVKQAPCLFPKSTH